MRYRSGRLRCSHSVAQRIRGAIFGVAGVADAAVSDVVVTSAIREPLHFLPPLRTVQSVGERVDVQEQVVLGQGHAAVADTVSHATWVNSAVGLSSTGVWSSLTSELIHERGHVVEEHQSCESPEFVWVIVGEELSREAFLREIRLAGAHELDHELELGSDEEPFLKLPALGSIDDDASDELTVTWTGVIASAHVVGVHAPVTGQVDVKVQFVVAREVQVDALVGEPVEVGVHDACTPTILERDVRCLTGRDLVLVLVEDRYAVIALADDPRNTDPQHILWLSSDRAPDAREREILPESLQGRNGF